VCALLYCEKGGALCAVLCKEGRVIRSTVKGTLTTAKGELTTVKGEARDALYREKINVSCPCFERGNALNALL
jgi:hypothetical protein